MPINKKMCIKNIKIYLYFIVIIFFLFCFCFAKADTKEIMHENRDSDDIEVFELLDKIGFFILPEDVNLVNKEGNKYGLWIEEKNSMIFLSNYSNGLKNGLEIIFGESGTQIKIDCLLVYSNDSIRSIISFNPKNGLPTGISLFLRDNKNPVIFPDNENKDYSLPFLFYSRYYDRNTGIIESEGYELMGNDWEIDNWMIGQWKFYNKDGGIIMKDYGISYDF